MKHDDAVKEMLACHSQPNDNIDYFYELNALNDFFFQICGALLKTNPRPRFVFTELSSR